MPIRTGCVLKCGQDLQRLMFADAIGQPIELTVLRNGAMVDVVAVPSELTATSG